MLEWRNLLGEEAEYTTTPTRPFIEEPLNQILPAAPKNDRLTDDITG